MKPGPKQLHLGLLKMSCIYLYGNAARSGMASTLFVSNQIYRRKGAKNLRRQYCTKKLLGASGFLD
jgi:hypothetical protein